MILPGGKLYSKILNQWDTQVLSYPSSSEGLDRSGKRASNSEQSDGARKIARTDPCSDQKDSSLVEDMIQECDVMESEGTDPLVKKRGSDKEGSTNWTRCDQCEQWRKTQKEYDETEPFFCRFLYPWNGNDSISSSWTGGCNTEPEAFNAFDRAYLKGDLTLRTICDCTENLLHKLPKDAVKKKTELVEKLKACDTCIAVAEMVRFNGILSVAFPQLS